MADNGDKTGLVTPVERLVLVDQVERYETGAFESHSLPGHLLHIVTAGSVSQWAEGRAEVFGKGAIVWYHENEPIRGQILRVPWRFITINFLAPSLPPPPDDRRVFPASGKVVITARRLLRLWRAEAVSGLQRHIRCYKELLDLLQQILPHAHVERPSPPQAKLWWRIERQLRVALEKSLTLADLERISGTSMRTINRACRAATGQAPMKRLHELRLSYAAGLLKHSDLPITEIAYRVGYSRPQEFSRDYHRRFGLTPREDRRRPPEYRKLQRPT